MSLLSTGYGKDYINTFTKFFLCFVKDLRGINSQNKQNNFLSFFCQRLEKYSTMLCADKKEEKSATSSPTRTRVRENEERTVNEKNVIKGIATTATSGAAAAKENPITLELPS